MVLNPMFGYREFGVAVNSPDVGKMFNHMASAAGCECTPLTQKSLPEALLHEGRHRWPICIGMADKPQRALLHELVEVGGDRRCIVKTNWWQLRTLVIQDWYGIESTSSRQLSAAAMQLVPGILPTYLSNLLSRQCRLESTATEQLELILDDMQSWLVELNVEPVVFVEARKLLRTDKAESIRDLVCSMIVEGYAQVIPGTPSREHIARIDTDLFVPEELFLGFVDKKTGLNLDPSLIAKPLEVADVLGASHNKRRIRGWSIKEKWLADRLVALRVVEVNG
jgi:hypothetical protein